MNICFFQLWPGSIKLIVSLAEQCAYIRWRATTSLLFCSRQAISFKALLNAALSWTVFRAKKKCVRLRLSLARRVVEKAFGILTQRFRVFLRPIAARVDVADKIVKASCCLHNFLMRDFPLTHDVNVETSRGMQNISNCPLGRMPTAGMNIRKIFSEYFLSRGSVAFLKD